MLKKNGRGVAGFYLVIAIVVLVTTSVGVADVTSSFQAIFARAVHDLAIAGVCPPPTPDPSQTCPYPDNAFSGYQGELCDSGISGSMGEALHVSIAKGNVWTRVPILTIYGNEEPTIDLWLTYNSLAAGSSDTPSTTMGLGWSLGLVDSSYSELPEDRHTYFPPDLTECVLGTGTLCLECVPADDPPAPISVRCALPGQEGLSSDAWTGELKSGTPVTFPQPPEPDTRFKSPQVIFLDSNGRKEVHNLDTPGNTVGVFPWPDNTGFISSPAWAGSKLAWAAPNGGELGERFCRFFPDGTKWYYGPYSEPRVKRIVSPRGLSTRYLYANGKISNVVDGFGRSVSLEYDGMGRLWKIHHPDALGSVTTLAYTTAGGVSLLESISDPLSNTTSFGYELVDGQYLMVREQLKNGNVYKCDYSDAGDLKARTLKVEKPTQGGSPVDEVVVQIRADWFPSANQGFLDPGASPLVQLTDGRGTDWEYHRNEYFQLTDRSIDGSPGTFATHQQMGDPHIAPAAIGRITHIEYPLGLNVSYSWLTDGRIGSETKELTQGPQLTYVTAYKYADDAEYPPGTFPSYYDNFLGLPVWKQQPDGGIWEYEYDDKGNVTLIRDPLNQLQETAYTYFGDNEGLDPGVLRPGRIKTISEIDRRGFLTVKTYNGLGDLVLKLQYISSGTSDCITTEYACDAMGRRTMEKVHRGDGTFATTTYKYDPLGRMTETVDNAVEVEQGQPSPDPDVFNLTTAYGYDGHGKMTFMVNPRGTRTEYTIDHRNRLESIIEDAGQDPENLNYITINTYDGNGNLETMTDAEEHVTSYTYDVADFVTQIVDPEGYVTKFERDEKGNPTKTWRQRELGEPSENLELVEEVTYDSLSRIHTRTPSGLAMITYDYGYGSTGGGGGGCGCSSGFGSSIPYRISDGDSPAGVTYNEVDLLGRVTKVIRKIGADDGPTPDNDDSVTEYTPDPEGNITQIDGPEGEITSMTYDGAGRMLMRTIEGYPSADLATSYMYNGVGNVTQVTLPTTHVMHYEYDEADRLKRVYDAEGEVAFYTRDANGNVRTRADGNGNAWTYVYDALDRMTEMHDPLVETPLDGIIRITYDKTGNVVERENRNINQDIEAGPLEGVKTHYVYDKSDRLRRTIEDYVEADYDENALCGTPGYGELLDESGEGGTQGGGTLQGGGGTPGGGGSGGGPSNGLSSCSLTTKNTVTTYEYDGRHLVKIFDNECNVTRYDYDDSGRIIAAYYPNTCNDNCNSSRVLFGYEASTRKILKRTDQQNITVEYLLDELGRLAQRRQYGRVGANPNAVVRIENFAWDSSNRLIGAEGQTEVNNNVNDGPEAPLPGAWTRSYDLAGRPITESQYFSGTYSAAYQTDIAYSLDTGAQTITQEMCYPSCGQRIVSRVWDGRGRLKSANAGSTIGVDWNFDDADRRVLATRRHIQQNTSSFAYDVNDRMTEIVHLAGPVPQPPAISEPTFSISYGYEPEGNRKFTYHSTQDYSDRGEVYGHDNRLRLTTMHRGALTQDSNGDWSVGTGDYIDHPVLASEQNWVGLDSRGNVLDYREAHSVGTAHATAHYEARAANGVNEYTSITPGCSVDSESGCLIGCPLVSEPYELKYDGAGNLQFDPWARNVGDPCPLPNGSVPDECKTNNACDETLLMCGRGQEFEYDLDNRLVRIRRDTNNRQNNLINPESIKLMEFKYDALGRRVETIEYVDAATGQVMDGVAGRPQPRRTRHVYFGLEVIQEYACGADGTTPPMNGAWPCSTSLPLVREFVCGDPDRYPEVVAMIRHNPDTQDQWGNHYLHDVLGSVIGLVDDAGELVERYTYDPYGKVFIEKWDATGNGGTGAWLASAEPTSGLPVSSVGNPFMWTGHRYDAAVGLYATHFRTYSPTLGRWLQRDPIEYDGGSSNLYEYVRSSPTQWFDPLGLSPGELRRKLKKLCATKICPDRAKRFKWGENGEACFYSDPDAYDQCNKDCESEADKIVNCLEAVIASANRGRGAICTNINPYSEHKACQLSLDFFKVEAFRPTRCRDNKPGRHVVTGIGPTGSDNYDVIVDALDWNNLFPPNLRLNILEPNSEGLLEDHLASQGGERHRTDGPRFPPTDPPPWERNPGIFPPE